MFLRISTIKWIEIFAVICGLSYTILITYGSILCWPAAIISSVLFFYLCVTRKIYADSALHVFYFLTAVYGWYNWGQAETFSPSSIGLNNNLWLMLLGFVSTILAGVLLSKYTDAKSPYLDSFVTVFSIIATFMMIYFVKENWIYWLVVDTLSIILYAKRGLYISALLFFIYDLLSINGLIQWQ